MIIPEVEQYLKDMSIIVEANDNTEDDDATIEVLNTFLSELLDVKKALEEDSLSEKELLAIQTKINDLVERSKEH